MCYDTCGSGACWAQEGASHPSDTFGESFTEKTILQMCEHFPDEEGEKLKMNLKARKLELAYEELCGKLETHTFC